MSALLLGKLTAAEAKQRALDLLDAVQCVRVRLVCEALYYTVISVAFFGVMLLR
jgi:hypothetical protein